LRQPHSSSHPLRGGCLTSVELLLGKKEVGDNVVVAGGGLIGCEVAAYLGESNKKVIIIEMLDDIGLNIPRPARIQLLEMLAKRNVRIVTSSTLAAIVEGAVIVKSKGERKEIRTDSVVLAVGLKGDSTLLEELRNKVAELHSVGDCVKPGRIIDAVWGAYRTARLI
jgi:NADPH-dependent 2,4-dienoyl-CoA reductase/sulfur reductase-like enzyme